MTVETLVHGPKEFRAALKYKELAEPVSESFHTQIELIAFLKGVSVASKYFGEPETLIYPGGYFHRYD